MNIYINKGQDRAGRPALVCDDCVLHLYFCIIVVLTLDRVCFGLYVASLNSFVLPCCDLYWFVVVYIDVLKVLYGFIEFGFCSNYVHKLSFSAPANSAQHAPSLRPAPTSRGARPNDINKHIGSQSYSCKSDCKFVIVNQMVIYDCSSDCKLHV